MGTTEAEIANDLTYRSVGMEGSSAMLEHSGELSLF